MRSQLYGRPELNLGSLSHLLGRRIPGYKDLPDWPLVPPDPLTREVAEPTSTQYPGQEEGDAARMLASRQSGSWRSDAHSEEEVSLCTESDEDLREEGEEEEESDQEQNEEESDQEHLKESQESEDEEEAGTGGSRSDWRRHGRTPSSTESSDAEFTASRPATRRQQPTRQKPPSPDITESATESESETEEQHSGWKDFAPVKPQSSQEDRRREKTQVSGVAGAARGRATTPPPCSAVVMGAQPE
ncbi:unnamed protein product [Schistocephalus solidus]|uniref:Uncharacterized protein n=1 Tax=Schistocephalus solidus TaxID=70667 RepID=A0A3P7D8B6_SCHSO|nr:unnamed protein product [Schistocephalus solidus]